MISIPYALLNRKASTEQGVELRIKNRNFGGKGAYLSIHSPSFRGTLSISQRIRRCLIAKNHYLQEV